MVKGQKISKHQGRGVAGADVCKIVAPVMVLNSRPRNATPVCDNGSTRKEARPVTTQQVTVVIEMRQWCRLEIEQIRRWSRAKNLKTPGAGCSGRRCLQNCRSNDGLELPASPRHYCLVIPCVPRNKSSCSPPVGGGGEADRTKKTNP